MTIRQVLVFSVLVYVAVLAVSWEQKAADRKLEARIEALENNPVFQHQSAKLERALEIASPRVSNKPAVGTK